MYVCTVVSVFCSQLNFAFLVIFFNTLSYFLQSRTHIMTRRERSFTVNAKGQYIRRYSHIFTQCSAYVCMCAYVCMYVRM